MRKGEKPTAKQTRNTPPRTEQLRVLGNPFKGISAQLLGKTAEKAGVHSRKSKCNTDMKTTHRREKIGVTQT